MISGIINHLWQSTLFALAAAVLVTVLRRNRAEVRYCIWLSVSLKFLFPLSILLGLGSVFEKSPAAQVAALPAVASAMIEISQPFPAAVVLPTSSPHNWMWIAILCGWGCGLAAIAVFRLCGWLRMRAAIRGSTPIELSAAIEVRCSPGRMEPGVFGLFHPVLLLPSGIFERLPPAQLEAVLAHELCHVRRRDNLTAAMHMIVEAIFWFHPAVWWIGAKLIEERERACDESVLRLGSEPGDYARAILEVCRHYLESPLACVPGVTGTNLNRRVRAILSGLAPRELSLARKMALAICAAVAVAAPLAIGILSAPVIRAQSAPPDTPRFEVVAIKPCKPTLDPYMGARESSPGTLSMRCTPLVDERRLGLIQWAYVRFADGHFHPLTVIPIKGAPAWASSEMYEIEAKAEGQPSHEMMNGPMLQALLEDRFKLKLHRETRQGPVYELTTEKHGPKLAPFEEGSCATVPYTYPIIVPPGQKPCKNLVSSIKPSIEAEGMTIPEFCQMLDLVLDRPVIDKTGISGRYDIHLTFARDEFTFPNALPLADKAPAASEPAPSIFTAIQEQLGLKLTGAVGPVNVLVIDHVERPSPN